MSALEQIADIRLVDARTFQGDLSAFGGYSPHERVYLPDAESAGADASDRESDPDALPAIELHLAHPSDDGGYLSNSQLNSMMMA
jgi:hypothetical protein